MKTATLWLLAFLAARTCATAVIAPFHGASPLALSPAAVSDTSVPTIAMVSDSVVSGDALVRESGAVRDFSVVWANTLADGNEGTSLPGGK